MLCQGLFKKYFDEPLRHEDTRGYDVFNPQISQISQIFLTAKAQRTQRIFGLRYKQMRKRLEA
jgi:hypothetical protein